MAQFPEFDPAKQPKYKVELHVHLDGSIRLTTLWELAQKKHIDINAKTLEDLYFKCRIQCPSSLEDFLRPFGTIFSVIQGDGDAIERMSYEFCEDVARQGVLYCEVRHCPHLLAYGLGEVPEIPVLTPRDVVMAVNRGISRGSTDFNLTVKSILCCFRGRPEWSNEILDLCVEFQNQGVVGIDVAGDEATGLCATSDFDVFKRAASLGIHRTAHAGEAGPASNVDLAVNELMAERIGHGYHIVDDGVLYSKMQEKGVHFEVCPYSSIMTGSVAVGCSKHPVVKFAEDNINFSISRDDPTIIQKTLDEEYAFLRGFGLSDVHLIRANFNAARNCFLPDDEKEVLIQKLREIYGIESSTSTILPSIHTDTVSENVVPDPNPQPEVINVDP